MQLNWFVRFDPARPADDLGCWSQVVGPFTSVVGYSAFGDFFLLDPVNERFAVLYTIAPELAPTHFYGQESFFSEFLTNAGIVAHLGRPNDVAILSARLGPLGPDEVYIPQPYPFLGGSGELDTFGKGNVWVFVDLVGQMQGIGSSNGVA